MTTARIHQWSALLIVGCITVGFLVRLDLARKLPIINDEQFYIYDAILFQPNNPVFWKTPLLISAESSWLKTVGLTSIVEPRLLIIISFLITAILFAATGVTMKKSLATGIGIVAVAMLLPPVQAFTSVVLPENGMLLPISALLLFTFLFRRQSRMSSWQLLLISSFIAMISAFRWSGIVWLLPTSLLLYTKDHREFWRRIFWVWIPYAAAVITFLAVFPDIARGYNIAGEFATIIQKTTTQPTISDCGRRNQCRETLGTVRSFSKPTGSYCSYLLRICALASTLVAIQPCPSVRRDFVS